MGIPSVAVDSTAVIVATVMSMIIGALWYSPSVFGSTWMKHMGFTKKHLQKAKEKGMGKSYLIMFIASLIMAYVLAHFIQYMGVTTAVGGMQTAFWIWLGFLATTQVSSVVWEQKSLGLYYINTGHVLVSLLVMGALLAVW